METKLTVELKKKIWTVTNKLGVFGCFEVTVGWYGKERVDYLTYDTNGIWRCYEIKVTKADFNSKASVTFIGDYNYYVMPRELYEQVKEEIPVFVGVYCGSSLVKRAKKQQLGVDEQILKNSMIRSLSRENTKYVATNDGESITRLKSKVAKLEKEKNQYDRKNLQLSNENIRLKRHFKKHMLCSCCQTPTDKMIYDVSKKEYVWVCGDCTETEFECYEIA